MDKSIKTKIKEPRIYLSLIILIMGFFPWIEVISKSEYSGIVDASAEAGAVYNGYQAIQYSFLGALIFLIPLALVLLEFLPQIKIKLRSIYLCGSLVGSTITLISMFISKAFAAKASASASTGGVDLEVETSVNLKVGFWLILVMYIGILVYTLIKDFAIKSTISEKGFKGLLSDVTDDISKELSDNAKTMSEENNVSCPKCGTNVVKGKKFCAKCGEKIQDDAINLPAFKLPIKAGKENKMLTVNEYILSMKDIRCEKCNEIVPVGKKFCPDCGEPICIKVIPDKCQNCGGNILKDRKYCPDCGNEITAVELKTNCENCNAELFYGKKYCVDCGTKVK